MATQHTEPQPSKGAMKAAMIITGIKHGSDARFETTYGSKTVKGIALLIDSCMSRNKQDDSDLLETLQAIVPDLDLLPPRVADMVRKAINDAT